MEQVAPAGNMYQVCRTHNLAYNLVKQLGLVCLA